MIEGELDMALSRPRYARHAKSPSGEAEEDAPKVTFTSETLGINFINVLRPGRPGGKPSAAISASSRIM
jgi:hypothetical protein